MFLKIPENIYRYVVEKRNTEFDTGKREIIRVGIAVISVGNISTGGTGKSPFVKFIAEELLKNSVSPAIISRGYRRKSIGEIIVSDGEKILASVEKSGDELMMLAENIPVAVIANEDKSKAAVKAVEVLKNNETSFKKSCIVVDDGFQHRKLHRDLDIVLIDTETLERPFLLPRGRLREPVASLQRADVIVLMNGVQENVFKKLIAENLLKENVVIAEAKTVAGDFYELDSREIIVENPFKNGVIAVSGIAKPDRFLKTLEARNLKIHHYSAFGDHHWFSENDVKNIIEKCEFLKINVIATTEKDAVKLRKFSDEFLKSEITVAVLPVKIEITKGRDEVLKRMMEIFE